MAFRKLTPLPERTSYSAEDWHFAEVTDPQPTNRALPQPIGLSDEEDAHRHLALRFDSMFCINCELHFSAEHLWCNACSRTLRPYGTAPSRRKHLPR